MGNTGRAEQVGSDVPEPSADPGRGEAFGLGRLLPRPSEAGGQRSGETELGVGEHHEPGPTVRGFGSTDLRGGPAENLPRRTFRHTILMTTAFDWFSS